MSLQPHITHTHIHTHHVLSEANRFTDTLHRSAFDTKNDPPYPRHSSFLPSKLSSRPHTSSPDAKISKKNKKKTNKNPKSPPNLSNPTQDIPHTAHLRRHKSRWGPATCSDHSLFVSQPNPRRQSQAAYIHKGHRESLVALTARVEKEESLNPTIIALCSFIFSPPLHHGENDGDSLTGLKSWLVG